MPRRVSIDHAAIDALFARQERLARHGQLRELGLPMSTLTSRIRPEGPWQRILPGVVLAHRGTPTHRERILGALLFAGEEAVVTGMCALAEYRVRAAIPVRTVHLLVPEPRQRSSYDFVVIQRTRRLPPAQLLNGLPLAPAARALADACRTLTDMDAVRELVAEVIQRGLCTVSELADEVHRGARQRSALSRRVLAEMDAGVRSVAESRTREILNRFGHPAPEWNVALWSASGEFLAIPDAYWGELAAALQIDSMRWHLSPKDYQRTQQRQRLLTKHGILVLPVAPQHIFDQPEVFSAEVGDLLRTAAARTIPTGVRVGPHPYAA